MITTWVHSHNHTKSNLDLPFTHSNVIARSYKTFSHFWVGPLLIRASIWNGMETVEQSTLVWSLLSYFSRSLVLELLFWLFFFGFFSIVHPIYILLRPSLRSLYLHSKVVQSIDPKWRHMWNWVGRLGSVFGSLGFFSWLTTIDPSQVAFNNGRYKTFFFRVWGKIRLAIGEFD